MSFIVNLWYYTKIINRSSFSQWEKYQLSTRLVKVGQRNRHWNFIHMRWNLLYKVHDDSLFVYWGIVYLYDNLRLKFAISKADLSRELHWYCKTNDARSNAEQTINIEDEVRLFVRCKLKCGLVRYFSRASSNLFDPLTLNISQNLELPHPTCTWRKLACSHHSWNNFSDLPMNVKVVERQSWPRSDIIYMTIH